MLTSTRNLVSIGRAARQAGTDVERFAEVAGQIGVSAAETLDGVPFLNREDAARVREQLASEANQGAK